MAWLPDRPGGTRIRRAAHSVVPSSGQPGSRSTAKPSLLASQHSGLVERIVCFGAVGISAGLRSWALATEVDLVFLSRRGSYLGHAWPAGQHPDRPAARPARLRQRRRAAVPFGRAVVDAKVRKQIVLLRRFARRDNAEAVTAAAGQMDQLLVMLPDCGTRDELMGIEGAAARHISAPWARSCPRA